MGSQIYMTLGAMVLLSVFILSTNNLIQNSSISVNDSEYFITAISLAQNVIDEAKTKSFDEELVSGSAKFKNSKDVLKILTKYHKMGREKDEEFNYPDLPDTVVGQIYNSTVMYDDFDDYNGYERIVDTRRADQFRILSIVEYVDPDNPDINPVKKEATLCKRITVLVTSPYIKGQTVKLQYAMTY